MTPWHFTLPSSSSVKPTDCQLSYLHPICPHASQCFPTLRPCNVCHNTTRDHRRWWMLSRRACQIRRHCRSRGLILHLRSLIWGNWGSFKGLARNSRVGPAERKPSEIRMPLRRLVARRKRPAEFVIDHIKAPIHSKIVPGPEA
jgi:hypothetical protein